METKAMKKAFRRLPAGRRRHSEQVGRLMEERAAACGLDPHEMYLLGKYHDIGYAIAPQDHAAAGAMLLEDEGFPFHDIVRRHGTPFCMIPETELRLLSTMDMIVDQRGAVVTADERVRDAKARFGVQSDEYRNFRTLAYQCGLIEG